jgi:hypothetical protein
VQYIVLVSERLARLSAGRGFFFSFPGFRSSRYGTVPEQYQHGQCVVLALSYDLNQGYSFFRASGRSRGGRAAIPA